MKRNKLALFHSGFLILLFIGPINQVVWAENPFIKPFVDKIERYMDENLDKITEQLRKGKAEKISETSLRQLEQTKEALQQASDILKEDTQIHEAANKAWEEADPAAREQAESRAAKLKSELDEDSLEIREEGDLEEKCKDHFNGIVKETACFCIKAVIETGSIPDEQTLLQFIKNRCLASGIECLTDRVMQGASHAVSASVAKTLTPIIGKTGESLADLLAPAPTPASKPLDDAQKVELYLLDKCFCSGNETIRTRPLRVGE